MEEKDTNTPRRYGDPIFDNAYNTGTAEIDTTAVLQIEDRYANEYLGGHSDAYEQHRNESLMSQLYTIMEGSKYGEMFLTKRKIPKLYHAELFVFLKQNIKDTSYNNSEVFTSIAEFLNVSYKTLYDTVPVVFREQILVELDQEYKVMEFKRGGRLF